MLQSVLCFVAETPGKQILLQVNFDPNSFSFDQTLLSARLCENGYFVVVSSTFDLAMVVFDLSSPPESL